MLPRIATLWERVHTSLWFLPGIMIVGTALLAWLAVGVDLKVGDYVWWLNQGSAQEAGSILSALLGSLITMTTLVISITMVVLTLAANQLGPRLIRSFVGDRRTQLVIGLFVGTVVYILLIFRLLDSDLPKSDVPHFAVTLASVLVFLCLLTLLFFLNHLSRSIVADTMINRVGDDLDRAIGRDLEDVPRAPELFAPPSGTPDRFCFEQSGYLQTVDHESLAAAVSDAKGVVELLVRPGHHLIAGRLHARAWPAGVLDEKLRAAIASAVVIGRERTPVQDIEFSARQLVEVALRALSPGINDPFTAIAVIDRLGAALALAMRHGEARTIFADADGVVRLVAPGSSFSGLADLACNQIRQAAAAHPDVLMAMLDKLGALAESPCNARQQSALRAHLDAVMETARLSIRHSGDLAAIEGRYEEAREVAAR